MNRLRSELTTKEPDFLIDWRSPSTTSTSTSATAEGYSSQQSSWFEKGGYLDPSWILDVFSSAARPSWLLPWSKNDQLKTTSTKTDNEDEKSSDDGIKDENGNPFPNGSQRNGDVMRVDGNVDYRRHCHPSETEIETKIETKNSELLFESLPSSFDEGREDEDEEGGMRRSSTGVKPPEFKERLDTMVTWFGEFDDEQRNLALKALLKQCGPSQNHCLSVAMETRFHQLCPPNCQDLMSWLPEHLNLYIFSFLDPVTLARSTQVCRTWRDLLNTPSLWQRFCRDPKWQLSSAGEAKQKVANVLPNGTVDWKRCFVECFRLRRNWLKGFCHVRTFEGHSQGITCVQFDDTRIVSGSSDKTIKVWNIRTNSPWSVMTLVGHSGTVRCLHLEGNRLVSGSSDCTIKVWDLSTQLSWSSIACKVTMVGHSETVRCLQVDEQKVVSGSYDRTLKVWDIATGECKHTLAGHEAAVLCVQFDDTKIVSGSCDRSIKIWNLRKGACRSTLHGHQDAVTCLQFDEVRILSGSLDRTIKFWCLETGNCLRTLDWMSSEGHTGVVRCLQADSWRFVSGGDDKTLKVWSLETGQRLTTLRNHTDGVTCLQFNDGVIVSGSYDKTVKLWDFSVC